MYEAGKSLCAIKDLMGTAATLKMQPKSYPVVGHPCQSPVCEDQIVIIKEKLLYVAIIH